MEISVDEGKHLVCCEISSGVVSHFEQCHQVCKVDTKLMILAASATR